MSVRCGRLRPLWRRNREAPVRARFARRCILHNLCSAEWVDSALRRTLQQARVRLAIRDAQGHAAAGVFGGLCVLAAWHALALVAPSIRVPGWAAGVLVGLPVVFAVGISAWRWRPARAVAAAVDGAGRTKDRLVTLLTLSPEQSMAACVQREGTAYLRQMDVRKIVPLRLRWRAIIPLVLPAAALALVATLDAWRDGVRAPAQAEAAALLAKAADVLTQDNPDLPPEFRDDVTRAQKLLADSQEPMRDALRTLSELEQKLAAAAAANQALTSEEREALAKALAASNARAAENLRSGDNQSAADDIAAMDPEALAKALEQAARHLEQNRLRDLARQQDTAKRLVAMLEPSDGQPGDPRSLQAAAHALRDIRTGQNPEPANGQMAQQKRGKGEPAQGDADDAPPTGSPGSELDRGRGRDLGGEQDPLRTASGGDESLTGQLDDGSSLVEIFRSAGADDPKARRAWKAAWDEAAPAALDAVATEQIPPGSRLLVRKYFEAIRPKD